MWQKVACQSHVDPDSDSVILVVGGTTDPGFVTHSQALSLPHCLVECVLNA